MSEDKFCYQCKWMIVETAYTTREERLGFAKCRKHQKRKGDYLVHPNLGKYEFCSIIRAHPINAINQCGPEGLLWEEGAEKEAGEEEDGEAGVFSDFSETSADKEALATIESCKEFPGMED